MYVIVKTEYDKQSSFSDSRVPSYYFVRTLLYVCVKFLVSKNSGLNVSHFEWEKSTRKIFKTV